MKSFRTYLPHAMAVLVGLAMLGVPSQANAAFRLTINATGGATQFFYASDPNSASFSGINIGNFTGALNTDSSNFPGSSIIGSLSQSLTLGSSGAGGNIDVLLEVINTVGGLATGQITDAGQITSLTNAALALFTLPVGNPLTLSSDVSVATNVSTTAGTTFNQTIANGTSLNSLSSTLNPAQAERITLAQFNGLPGYTLSNHLIVTGINAGAQGTSLTAVSGVTATPTATTPAPGGIVLLAAAAPFSLGWLRRRAQSLAV